MKFGIGGGMGINQHRHAVDLSLSACLPVGQLL